MMARRGEREKGERRRRMAELNLLSETRTRTSTRRRGCALLPLMGLGVTLLALATALLSGHL
jgi:hypothetical protein